MLQVRFSCSRICTFHMEFRPYGRRQIMIVRWCNWSGIKGKSEKSLKNTKRFSRNFCSIWRMKVVLAHHPKSESSLSRADFKKQDHFLVKQWKMTGVKYRKFSSLSESQKVDYGGRCRWPTISKPSLKRCFWVWSHRRRQSPSKLAS